MTDLAPDAHEAPPAPATPLPEPLAPPPRMTRGRAIVEVLLCSSYPTQILAAATLAAAGIHGLTPDGGLDARFVIGVALLDAVLVTGLIVLFMWQNGESLAATFLARRPTWREVVLGVALAPLVLLGVALVVVTIRAVAPSLHNVPANPMGALMRDPMVVATFAVVVVVAGGLREELQRGFQLHRLTGHVCGPLPALLLASVAFGAGHTVQGYDVAVATGVLGAAWGALFLFRHSIAAGATSHALFNFSQVLAAWTIGEMPGG